MSGPVEQPEAISITEVAEALAAVLHMWKCRDEPDELPDAMQMAFWEARASVLLYGGAYDGRRGVLQEPRP